MRLTGATDDDALAEVWAYLTRDEAYELYSALVYYFEDDAPDPQWHTHVGGDGGTALTIAVAIPGGRDRPDEASL